MTMKFLRISHDGEATALALQQITVASTLWLQAHQRPSGGCRPVLLLQRVGDPLPTTIWEGTDRESWQYTGTVRVDDVAAGDYFVLVGGGDMSPEDHVDCLCLSAQTTMTDPTQLVPVSDATAVDDPTWLAAWTAIDASLSVVEE